jgi:hypothetical protein
MDGRYRSRPWPFGHADDRGSDQSDPIAGRTVPRHEAHAGSDQDHGGVTVTVPGTLAGGFLEPLDLFFGQVLPRPEFRIRGSARNCPVYDG